MYSVLIVDDEFLARKLLQGYVQKVPELTLAGTAQNAFEAFSFVKEHPVDILLLDIHMPDLNGIELARMLHNIPAIIFTTAYSEYALESYEVNAVDYLLKPIALPRFMQAIEKALLRLNNAAVTTPGLESEASASDAEATSDSDETDETIQHTAAETTNEINKTAATPYLMVKADYRLYKINFDDLIYIEGQHEYVSFYTPGKRITALYSLKSLEEQLPPNRFVRVHKSYIVSIAHISEIEQLSITVAGQKLPIGGSYRDQLLHRLGL